MSGSTSSTVSLTQSFDRPLEPDQSNSATPFWSRFRVSTILMLMLMLMVIIFIASSYSGARQLRNLLFDETTAGLDAQLETMVDMLALIHRNAATPEQALVAAKPMLYALDWYPDRSGYGMLFEKRTARLLAYPPDKGREGEVIHLDGIEEGGTLTDAVIRAGRSVDGVTVHYTYNKPGTEEDYRKATIFKPVPGTDWVVGSGVYLDRGETVFRNSLISTVSQVTAIVFVLACLMYLFRMHLKKRVSGLAHNLKAIAEKDLSGNVRLNGNDEFSELSGHLAETQAVLRELLAQQSAASESVATASTQLDGNIAQARQAMDEELQQLSAVATAMEEMAVTVREVAENAVSASEAAGQSSSRAFKGEEAIEHVVSAITGLTNRVRSGSESVARVEQEVKGIGSIVDAIKGISEQTNLLALNAAIESARAGEHGRGFSVVADEVRQLAGRTREATEQITETIGRLQQSTLKTVEMMGDSVQQAEQGVAQAETAGKQFQGIVSDISILSDRSHQIATAAEEQSTVAADMSANVEGLKISVESTDEVIAEINHASTELRNQAKSLDTLIGSFRV